MLNYSNKPVTNPAMVPRTLLQDKAIVPAAVHALEALQPALFSTLRDSAFHYF